MTVQNVDSAVVFVRLTIWTDMFNLIERIARGSGGWPTNSAYECRNGLKSSVGYHFTCGIPNEFIRITTGLGAVVEKQ